MSKASDNCQCCTCLYHSENKNNGCSLCWKHDGVQDFIDSWIDKAVPHTNNDFLCPPKDSQRCPGFRKIEKVLEFKCRESK